MTKVTVKQLAESVKVPVDRLVKQMQEAGLKHNSDADLVSEDEKQRKQKRIDEFYKKMTGGKSNSDPEDYYGYNPPNRNPFAPNRNYPTFSENQFEG